MAVKFSFLAFVLSLAALLVVLLRTSAAPVPQMPAAYASAPAPADQLPVIDTADHGNWG